MFDPKTYGRSLAPGQRSELNVMDVHSGESQVVFSTDSLIEAPNWTPDGETLIFNAGGTLWRLALGSNMPVRIETGPRCDFNNDHVVSPDGKFLFLSSDDGHLYRVGLEGGEPVRISNLHEKPFHYYLHGISPDGLELAYVGVEGEGIRTRTNIFTIPTAGGPDRRLTDMSTPCDGPEYTPDGRTILFNSEFNAAVMGQSQIFSMATDGSELRQLTRDDRVNWFPHTSPDGTMIAYLSYPPGTLGHPEDRPVLLWVILVEHGGIRDLAQFNGGQGTINVNSWAPDSRRFAYVAYPFPSRGSPCLDDPLLAM